jgi:diadenylate cyclase
LFPFIRPQDIADILIMSFLVYQLYNWFKNTKALQVVIGLGFLVLLYMATKNLGLFMTSWVLQELGTVLFVLLIVIFQSEIRQALYRFSLLRNMFGRQGGNTIQLDLIDLSRTIFDLAKERTGAIIVFQRKELLDEYLLHGISLDSLVSSQLLGTLFRQGTPLHDGAVVIKGNRVTQASCHLPLSTSGELPIYYGTRHRAALGLSERSDAVVIVVSEERGEVSIALSGRLTKIDTPELLSERLHSLLATPAPEATRTSLSRVLFSDLWPKLTIFLLVCICWLIITAKQGGIVTVTAPLKFHNLPEGLALVKSSPEELEIQLKAFSSLTPSPKQIDITADMNLSGTREGINTLSVKSSDFQLPLGVIISGITPSTIKVTMDKKMHKTLRIRVRSSEGHPGVKLRIDPPTVEAVGPQHLMERIDSVETEEVDVSAMEPGDVIEKRLLSPAPQVRLLREEPVKIRIGRN